MVRNIEGKHSGFGNPDKPKIRPPKKITLGGSAMERKKKRDPGWEGGHFWGAYKTAARDAIFDTILE